MSYKLPVTMFSVLAVLAGCTSKPIPSAEWSCRNTAAEISCQDGACTLAPKDEFTPMELTFDSSGGISLCAYSGCWSGKAGKTLTAGNYFTVIGNDLSWSAASGAPADISATINMKTNVATLLTDDYAHPMICTAS